MTPGPHCTCDDDDDDDVGSAKDWGTWLERSLQTGHTVT